MTESLTLTQSIFQAEVKKNSVFCYLIEQRYHYHNNLKYLEQSYKVCMF